MFGMNTFIDNPPLDLVPLSEVVTFRERALMVTTREGWFQRQGVVRSRELLTNGLSVKTHSVSAVRYVIARGDIELANVHVLSEPLDRVLARTAPVLLDLTGVRYTDSTGLNFLLRIHDRSRQKYIPFAVAANPLLRRICGVLSLQTVFPIFSNTTLAHEYLIEEMRPTRRTPNGICSAELTGTSSQTETGLVPPRTGTGGDKP